MILLSEVADKVLDEIQSWPSELKSKVRITCAPKAADARIGDERTLIELILLPLAYPGNRSAGIDVDIKGFRKDIRIVISNIDESAFGDEARWKSAMVTKAHDWNPRVEKTSTDITIILNIPSAEDSPPADLGSMAREIGIEPDDARMILDGFVRDSRGNMDILRRQPTTEDAKQEQFRAAHSLKGAGKTLRAPELASAANAVEKAIRDSCLTGKEIRRLENAWVRLEQWLKEVKA